MPASALAAIPALQVVLFREHQVPFRAEVIVAFIQPKPLESLCALPLLLTVHTGSLFALVHCVEHLYPEMVRDVRRMFRYHRVRAAAIGTFFPQGMVGSHPRTTALQAPPGG